MSNKKPTIICITGPDGSGKSTLISNLINEVSNTMEVTIWDALNNKEGTLFSTKKDIDDYLCLLSPNARLLFLAHALQYAIDKALTSDVEIVFINAYYYKYFSSEKVLGADQKLIDALISNFPIPDKTIFLSVSPQISTARKKYLSRYECGCRAATLEHFIDFQKKVNLTFETYIQPEWFILDAKNSPEVLKDKTLKIIAQ
ncbi:P-loop NTPase fold protein [uncultured Aquimarina sp.]|uniref:dTMP kinase n=1 Tax=uncultured Aquimarina sp. TaxID=575652 RepID=UPI002632FCF3|nr:P-loop NTPase fold protein [uncultured Aquimarina sp.]